MDESESSAIQRTSRANICEQLQAAGFDDVEEIGRGGFAVVFRCTQRELDRVVAVKVLKANLEQENMQRFVREQRAMGRMSGHPHIVTVFGIGTTADGYPYIVMQYHARGSLGTQIHDSGPLGWAEVLRLGVKMAGALESAHRAGMLHRDVKPDNILLTDYGEPQLTDFGIAHITGGFQTSAGLITGTPAFTAPEVLEGRAPTPASDVYGLGATLFCALTGHEAHARRSGEQVVAQLLRIISEPAPRLCKEGVPDDVCAVIERALARQPADRPASAAAFGEELREVQRCNNVPVDEMALIVEPSRKPPTTSAPPLPTMARTRSGRSATVAPPTAATKYRPPESDRALVVRSRLIDVLHAGRRKRLTLIHAPSGFGKTTLAGQWREELAGMQVAAAWLTIDDDDNNVVWFLAHLLESIRGLRPTLADELSEELEARPEDAERYVLASLINDLHTRNDQVVVIIDDWHRVTDSATIAAMRYLLDHGCHHLPIIIASSTRSGLSLSRLRIHSELVDINTDALRFNTDDTRSFLVDTCGLQLSDADIDALTEVTDGWAAALQLAAVSLSSGVDSAQLINRMSDSEDISEFLAENVLEALDPTLLEFLLTTSILDRICGGLASAVTGVDRGQAMLEEVESRGLFLHRLDDRREWFQYHRLFADHLRRRLERDRPEQIETLHYRASEWFSEHNLLNEAVDHALAAGNPERAVDLVEQGEAVLLGQSKLTTLLGILAKLPNSLIAARPRIQLLLAWVNIFLLHPTAALAALQRFDFALNKSVLTDEERTDLCGEADVIKGTCEIYADRIDTAYELVRDVLARPNSFNPMAVGVAGNIATIVETYRFNFDEARRWQRWSLPYHELAGPFGVIRSRCYAGVAAKEQLDIQAATHLFRDAFDTAVDRAGPRSHAARLVAPLLAELLYEKGELAEASALLDQSYGLGVEGAGVDFMIARYVMGARLKAVDGDLDTAENRLADGDKAARDLDLPRLAAWILNERIRLGFEIAAQERDRLLSSRTIPSANGIATIIAELDEDSAVRLLLRSTAPEQRAQACDRARAIVAGIDPEQRPLAALRARLLLVAALAGSGHAREAETELAPAAATCTDLGLTRLLLDATSDLSLNPRIWSTPAPPGGPDDEPPPF